MLKIRYRSAYSKYELAQKAIKEVLEELRRDNKKIKSSLYFRDGVVIKFFLVTIGNIYKKHEFVLAIDEAKNNSFSELKNKIKNVVLKEIDCFS